MRRPIAGVAPAELHETTVLTAWPSIGAGPLGRLLGQLYSLRAGLRVAGVPITIGYLIALVTAPLAVFLYFHKIVPRLPLVVFGFRNPNCRRYRVTNRRVVIDHPFTGHVFEAIALEAFDAVAIDVLPGHTWYRAGDIVLSQGGSERFRLAGVPHPEAFQHTCEKVRVARAGVARALASTAK